MTSAAGRSRPMAVPRAATQASVAMTWSPPPNRAIRHSRQALERQLKADLEQQEDDAQLGERAHAVGLVDQTEAAGPQQRPHHEKPGDGRQPQPLEDRDARRRHGQQNQDFGEELRIQVPQGNRLWHSPR